MFRVCLNEDVGKESEVEKVVRQTSRLVWLSGNNHEIDMTEGEKTSVEGFESEKSRCWEEKAS